MPENKCLMSSVCVCDPTDIFIYSSMLKLSLFEGLQKKHRFVSGPLNANELVQRAGFQELVKQQHYTVTKVRKVKSYFTTPLSCIIAKFC